MVDDNPKNEIVGAEDAQQRRIKYNQAVRSARLVTLLLSSVNFSVNRKALDPDDADADVKPTYGGRIKQVAFDAKEGNLLCTVEWTVDFKYKRKRFVRCSADYDVAYGGLVGFEESTIALLAENVARPASYAYFRALFANLDWSAELRSPPLPMVTFQPKI
ncbi:hypothetical protein [Bradyrhizobium japonicum]|uniref:hypothetical protein n=1 Tax=Bradyrhizobium japonicum TaxID=375 RepID=UPI000576B1F9|nr:hypothetical protein [Bradyrhizobium japonicum]